MILLINGFHFFQAIKRSRGQLNIVLQISTTDKESLIVLEEHRRLLKILLTHELLTNNSEQFQWKDDFSKEALLILSQHAIQGRMNRFQTAMIRWLVYCEIHNILPLDYRVFTPILDKIRSHVLEKSMQGIFYIIQNVNYFIKFENNENYTR